MLHESREVAHRREPEAEDERVLGAVDQLIDAPRLKPRWIANLPVTWRHRATLRTRAEAPLGVCDRNAWILLFRAHRQRRQKTIGERCAVVGADGRIARVAHKREPSGRQV